MLKRSYQTSRRLQITVRWILFGIVIAIILIGGVSAKRDKDKIQALQAQLDKKTPAQADTQTSQGSPSIPTYYVELAPFGVSFPYSGPNITYTTIDTSNIYLGLEGLDDPSATMPPTVNDACGEAALGVVTKSTDPKPGAVVTHIGDYYYGYTPNKNVCSTTKDVKNRVLSTEKTLSASFKSLRAVE